MRLGRVPGWAFALIVAFGCATVSRAPAGHAALDVMTFNIRYAHTEPPNLWPDRLPVIVELVERRMPDVIGTQEGLYHQLLDLDSALVGYDWIGIGRDGGSRGEFMAVFYRTDRLEPLEYDHYWLSDTPAVAGSKSWGNRYARMVTSVRFRDRASGEEFVFVNTHLDHESQESRERSAALIVERLSSLAADVPLVLLGDFNAGAGENPVHATLTGAGGFTDTWAAAGNADTSGTFHAFRGPAEASGKRRIDWILVRGPVSVLSSEIVTDARAGQLPSDHFPVVARLRLN